MNGLGVPFVLGSFLLLQTANVHGAPADSYGLIQPRSHLRHGFADEHIVGGEYIDIEQAPYQLSIELFWMHHCGAAIINEIWALTAGHCYIELDFIRKYTVWVRAGSTTIFLFGMGGKVHFLEEMIPHPSYEYSEGFLDFDLALIKIRTAFQFSNRIKSLPLPTASKNEEEFLDFNINATVSGWGHIGGEKYSGSIYLKRANIPLVRRYDCEEAYGEIGRPISPQMICAGGFRNGDSCQGDSGGPLKYKDHLIGIVSWGSGCNFFPGVYTNLFNPGIRSFIQSKSGL